MVRVGPLLCFAWRFWMLRNLLSITVSSLSTLPLFSLGRCRLDRSDGRAIATHPLVVPDHPPFGRSRTCCHGGLFGKPLPEHENIKDKNGKTRKGESTQEQQQQQQHDKSLPKQDDPPPPPPTPPPLLMTVYQVCLSPACLADGAMVTLEKLQALAPPHVRIETASCFSFCGNGPAVLQEQHEWILKNPNDMEDLFSPTYRRSSSTGKPKTKLQEVITRRRDDSEINNEKDATSSTSSSPKDASSGSRRTHRNAGGTNNITVKYKRIAGDKILDLLSTAFTAPANIDGITNRRSGSMGSGVYSYPEPPPSLHEGYEMARKADALFAAKQYSAAIVLYEQAMNKCYQLAVQWQRAREQVWETYQQQQQQQLTLEGKASASYSSSLNNSNNHNDGLEWLIRARRNQAAAHLEQNQIPAALLAAHDACQLSKQRSAVCFQILARAYGRTNNVAAERQALKTMFALYETQEGGGTNANNGGNNNNNNKLSFQEQAERRELGFRLAKLEREVATMLQREQQERHQQQQQHQQHRRRQSRSTSENGSSPSFLGTARSGAVNVQIQPSREHFGLRRSVQSIDDSNDDRPNNGNDDNDDAEGTSAPPP